MANRFKGLDLIDREPEELWTRFVTLYRRQGSRPSPREKKMQKGKWLSDEALQIAEKRREVEGKGEKERYNHLNAEFQRIARRDKKTLLSDQCKEIEENNRKGETQMSFSILVSSGYMPRRGIPGSYGGFIPSFKGIAIPSSIVAVSICTPTNSARVFPFLHTFSSIYCL